MRTTFTFLALALLLCGLSYSKASAQITNLDGYDSLTIPVGANVASVRLQRPSGMGGFSGWSVISVPPGGAASDITFTQLSSPNTRTWRLDFNANSDSGKYTVRATGASSTLDYDIYMWPANAWYAVSNATTKKFMANNLRDGSRHSSPTFVRNCPDQFAAAGRSPYPQPNQGAFYWIPNTTTNAGVFSMYGTLADGTGGVVTMVNNFDVNGTDAADMYYVRMGVAQNGVTYLVPVNATPTVGDKIFLVSIPTLGNIAPLSVNNLTPNVIDADVSISGNGAARTDFFNGDVALDGNNNLFVLTNTTGGQTKIYKGVINGANTDLALKWIVRTPSGANFSNAMTGICFDNNGGIYISEGGTTTESGLYYLDPATISNPPTNPLTVNTIKVQDSTDITDMGTNAWPSISPLPVIFGNVNANYEGDDAVIKWVSKVELELMAYDIEESTDGVTFRNIGTQNAIGTSELENHYSWRTKALTGRAYYRVVGINANGSRQYSNIVSLKKKPPQKARWLLAPTPLQIS